MSRSATPATRNETTRRLKPPKVTPFAELTIGTASDLAQTLANGCERRTVADGCVGFADGCLRTLRTVAAGCGRLGNVERTHPRLPDPQSETGILATHSGKRPSSCCRASGRLSGWDWHAPPTGSSKPRCCRNRYRATPGADASAGKPPPCPGACDRWDRRATLRALSLAAGFHWWPRSTSMTSLLGPGHQRSSSHSWDEIVPPCPSSS